MMDVAVFGRCMELLDASAGCKDSRGVDGGSTEEQGSRDIETEIKVPKSSDAPGIRGFRSKKLEGGTIECLWIIGRGWKRRVIEKCRIDLDILFICSGDVIPLRLQTIYAAARRPHRGTGIAMVTCWGTCDTVVRVVLTRLVRIQPVPCVFPCNRYIITPSH
jgi:hypothetical protein